MKLLLTSGGIKNDSMRKAIYDLAETKEIRIAFIITAGIADAGDKDWLIRDLVEARSLGPVDIIDIASLPRDIWEPRIKAANVIVFGGGNSFYLLHWLKKSGLDNLLPELLNTRLYVGISAGSIVTNPSLMTSNQAKRLYAQEQNWDSGEKALNFVPFYVRPHLNSPRHPNARTAGMEQLAKEVPGTLYAYDDQTAIQVIDGAVTIISEGVWEKYNS